MNVHLITIFKQLTIMRRKLLSMLALLCLTVSSAWAQWTGGTYTATADEVVSAITVNTDATLTINAGVTVTVNGVLDIQGGQAITVAKGKTLTIVGPGTLTVYGLDGADGTDGSNGTNSVAAITGDIIVKGATVNAIGGAAGNGGDSSTGKGGNGAVGARGFSNGTVTIYYGTINATGGKGGNGGNSTAGQGGNGGQGGYAFVVTALNYYGGIVNATSGVVGKGGTGSAGNGSDATRRKAFGDNYLTLENTQATLTGDGANITPATKPTVNNYYTVNIVPNVVASGNCGTSVNYSLTSDGVLTISGTGAMADYATSNLQPWKNNRTSITSIVVGENVTHIGNNTFTSCTNATSVLLPTTLTSIGRNAFLGCNNASLTSISIPASVTSIGNYAFKDCSNLATVNIGSGVTSIGSQAFAGCTSLGTVTIPNSVTSIDYDAFKGCSSLATVTLNSNPFIGEDAFPAGATVTMNLTANAAGGAYWLTFYNENHNFEADANTQIFKAALTGTKLELTELTTDQTVTKDKPVILKSTAGTITMTLTSTASGNDFDGNSLEGVWDPEGQPGTAGNIFVLNNGAQGVGFYRLATGKTLGVGKAYLTYDGGAGAREFFLFGETTGIEMPKAATTVSDAEVYDLQGRRVQNPVKGLYIVNGKKVFINK